MINLSYDQYTTIIRELRAIRQLLEAKPNDSAETFIDNWEFLRLMRISKRTAQSWRQSGIIPYSQIGNKIYYSLDDVDKLLEENRKRPLQKSRSRQRS